MLGTVISKSAGSGVLHPLTTLSHSLLKANGDLKARKDWKGSGFLAVSAVFEHCWSDQVSVRRLIQPHYFVAFSLNQPVLSIYRVYVLLPSVCHGT